MGFWMPALLSSTWMGQPLAFRSSHARLMALQTQAQQQQQQQRQQQQQQQHTG
jgi:hypothetical protein